MSGYIRIASIGTALFLGAQSLAAQTPDSLALSLEDAIARALRNGDETQMAQALVGVADAQILTARAAGLPQLRLSYNYQHVFANARAQAVGQIFNQPNTYNTNANLSQTVFQGGRVFAGWRAASRLRGAARLNVQEASQQAALDAQRVYFQALFAGRMVAIRASNFQLASDRVSQVEKFQLAGRAARYDVLRARVERSNLEPMVVEARSDYDLALLELKRLTNIPADQDLKLTSSLDATAVQPLLVTLTDEADAVANRASVRAAELFVKARRDAIAVARADLLPSVNIFFQTGYQAFPKGGIPRQFSEPGGWYADRIVGITASWPLFDGLRTKGTIDLAQANAKIAEIQLTQEREAVAVEVEAARGMLERARSQFVAHQQNVGEADEAFKLASLRFTRGLDTQLEVSDAQLALLTAQTNEARAIFDLVLASADLARALGRPLPLTTPTRPAPRSTTSSINDATPR